MNLSDLRGTLHSRKEPHGGPSKGQPYHECSARRDVSLLENNVRTAAL